MVPGQGFDLPLLALMEKDLPYLLERVAATVQAGRVPLPASADLVLSEDLANMLDVSVGDTWLDVEFVIPSDSGQAGGLKIGRLADA